MCDQDIIKTVDTSDDDKDENQEILDAMWDAAQNGDDLLTAVKDVIDAINKQKDKSKDEDEKEEDEEN